MKANKLIYGNCLDYLPEIDKNSIDLIFTDPPYIRALADLYKNWNGRNMDFDVYGELFSKVLKPTGQVAIFGDLPTTTAIMKGFSDYFEFRYYYVWQKSNGQPISKYQPISNTEIITVWKLKGTKTGDLAYNPIFSKGKPYTKKHNAGNITRKSDKTYTTRNNGFRNPTEIIKAPSKDNMKKSERYDHPTQKPLSLAKYVISTLSEPGDIILDPFMGSGSIPLSALEINRKFIGIEKNPKYYKIAKSRLEKYNNQQSIFNEKPKLTTVNL